MRSSGWKQRSARAVFRDHLKLVVGRVLRETKDRAEVVERLVDVGVFYRGRHRYPFSSDVELQFAERILGELAAREGVR
jgi:hypothetical protein